MAPVQSQGEEFRRTPCCWTKFNEQECYWSNWGNIWAILEHWSHRWLVRINQQCDLSQSSSRFPETRRQSLHHPLLNWPSRGIPLFNSIHWSHSWQTFRISPSPIPSIWRSRNQYQSICKNRHATFQILVFVLPSRRCKSFAWEIWESFGNISRLWGCSWILFLSSDDIGFDRIEIQHIPLLCSTVENSVIIPEERILHRPLRCHQHFKCFGSCRANEHFNLHSSSPKTRMWCNLVHRTSCQWYQRRSTVWPFKITCLWGH